MSAHNGSGKRRYWLLARPGILRVLAILYEHGAMPIHQISMYGVGNGSAYRGATEAAKLGLARLYRCNSSRCAELTPEGRRVAEKLHELLETLAELGLAEPLRKKTKTWGR